MAGAARAVRRRVASGRSPRRAEGWRDGVHCVVGSGDTGARLSASFGRSARGGFIRDMGYRVFTVAIAAAALGMVVLTRARAQQTGPLQIQSFSVGPDETLTYPNNSSNPPYLLDLPD